MSDLELIRSTLAKTMSRRRLERGFRGVWHGLLIGAALWVAVLILHKLVPLVEGLVPLASLLLPAGALVGFLIGWFRPMTLGETARWLDGQKGLQERLSTALETAGREEAGDWPRLLVADAARSAQEIQTRQLLPLRLPAVSRWALLLLVLGVGLGFVPEYRTKDFLNRKKDEQVIKETGRELAQLTKRTLEARPLAAETARQSLEDVQELGEHLAKAQLTRGEALKDLASMTEKLKEQTRDLAKNPAIRNLERAARNASKGGAPGNDLQQKLENMAKQAGANAANSEAMENLRSDLAKAKEAAANLPNDRSAEAKEAQEKLNAALSDLAKQAKDLGLDLPSLSEAVAALQNAAPDQVLKDLQVAEIELEKMEAMARALEKMQLDAENLGKDLAEQLRKGQAEAAESTLRKMAQALQSPKISEQEAAKMMEEVRKALSEAQQYSEVGDHMQEAMKNLEQGQKGEGGQNLAKAADALGKMMGELGDAQSLLTALESLQQASMSIANGMGYSQDGKPGFGRKSGNPTTRGGVGTWHDEESWAYPEYSDKWDNTGIEQPELEGRGVSDKGDGQLADNLAPTKIKGQITPGGPMPSITMRGVSIKGNSKVQVEEMAAAAQSEAQSALSQDQVPRAYQNAVRNYFDDLKE